MGLARGVGAAARACARCLHPSCVESNRFFPSPGPLTTDRFFCLICIFSRSTSFLSLEVRAVRVHISSRRLHINLNYTVDPWRRVIPLEGAHAVYEHPSLLVLVRDCPRFTSALCRFILHRLIVRFSTIRLMFR